jgi:hypothetical protein
VVPPAIKIVRPAPRRRFLAWFSGVAVLGALLYFGFHR